MARKKGVASLGFNFQVEAAAPLDTRTVVQNLTDLTSESTWLKDGNLYIYEGMEVYVEETKNKYLLTDPTNYNNIASWKVSGSGSGTSLPAGGTTNQALVKASDADYDFKYDDVLTTEALDNRTLTPSGWGVAKTGIVQIPNNGGEWGEATIDISELGFTNTNDYSASLLVVSGAGGYGGVNTYIKNKTTTGFVIHWARVEGGSATRVDYEYTIIAKGYGGTRFAQNGLPVGGTAEQILSKVNDQDGIAHWIDDEGRNLTKFERKYGAIPASKPITQRVGQYESSMSGEYSYTHRYSVPAQGVFSSVDSFINGLTNTFDVYITGSRFSGEKKVSSAGSIEYGGRRGYYEGEFFIAFQQMTVQDGKLLFYTYDTNTREYAAITGVRFVAKGNNNFGVASGAEPYDIRNLTGMVLDDLKVTGNAIPTDWGMATTGITTSAIPKNNGTTTIDLSEYNFSSPDDYYVAVVCKGGTTASPIYYPTDFLQVVEKTATSCKIRNIDSNYDRNAQYTIFAKGYGNNTMQGGGSDIGTSLPAGGTTGQALVKKSDTDGDVEWADINIPDGWGVAKSETISVPITNTAGSFTINIADLGIASVDDYNVVFSVVGGTGSGAWGDSNVYAWGRNTSAINGSVNTTGGDIQSILVSYVVVAKGFGGGGAGGVSLPKGGTTGQILAKASDNDGDAYWISNAGSDLVKYERQYGVYAQSTSVTQLVATNAGKATSVSTRYEIPIVGCLTSIVNKATREENKEAFTNAITNAFDVYVEVENEGSERKLESRVQSADSTVRWVMNPQKFTHERVSYLFEQIQNNKISLLFSYRDDRLTSSSTRATVGSVRLVAKNGNNFGISTGTDPKYVRNLTGMVLDDLGIAGSNIPTSWGVAVSGTAGVPIVNQVGQFAFSVSGLGITNPDDYNVTIEVIGGGTGNWGDSKHYIWEKSTDRFAGSITTTGSDVDRVDISYTIFAKGYGNLTQNSGSSIPAGYSPMQIEMVDSNGVTHTYEFLGKEITP